MTRPFVCTMCGKHCESTSVRGKIPKYCLSCVRQRARDSSKAFVARRKQRGIVA